MHNKNNLKMEVDKMITAEVSLYPQKTTNASQIISSSLNSLGQLNLKTNVGSISTKLQGRGGLERLKKSV